MKYKFNYLITLSIILICQKQAQSQELSENKVNNIDTYAPTTGINGALLGSIIHPGFKVGIERPYKFTQVDKLRIKRTKTFNKERYLSYSLGMYYHTNYHTNYFLQTEWIARRQKSKGFYIESSFGLGISRTFVNGATYIVTDNGEVEKVGLSGNWFGLASLGGSIGYNANLKKQKPYSIYLRHNWLIFFPYNGFVTPRPTIELGARYNLSGFWEATPSKKSKEKQSLKYKKSLKK